MLDSYVGLKEPADGYHWVGTWACSPQGPFYGHIQELVGASLLRNITIRQIVTTTIGGDLLRLRFSNAFGREPLVIEEAHVSARGEGSAIVPDLDRLVTFEGHTNVSIPVGETVSSDAIHLSIPPLADLAVSIYSPGNMGGTGHVSPMLLSYLSSEGDYTSSTRFPVAKTLKSGACLTGVDVFAPPGTCSIVVMGDCFTDGANSTPGAKMSWLHILAERLVVDGYDTGVLNAGIIGNRVLYDGPPPFGPVFGTSALERFERDVLSQSGAQYLILSSGLADIFLPDSCAPLSESVTASQLFEAFQELVHRAHLRGLHVFGCTLQPFQGASQPGAKNIYSLAKEEQRSALNNLIRTRGLFDAVIDFDQLLRDSENPLRLFPKYDDSDHLHINDAGHKAVADAIDLSLFR